MVPVRSMQVWANTPRNRTSIGLSVEVQAVGF